MNDTPKISLKRLAAEAVAIVVSILLAFAIEAWWQDRLERELESQHLSRLLVELKVNIELIDDFQFLARSTNAGLRIIELVEDAQIREAEVINVRAFDLFQLTQAYTFEAETSVFDGLVRSGNMEVIRNQQVVSALAAWERSIRDYTDLAAIARTTAETLLLPALHKRADTTLAFRANPQIRGSAGEREAEISLIVDIEIKGLIAQKIDILRSAERAFTEMREAATAVIEAIDAAQSE